MCSCTVHIRPGLGGNCKSGFYSGERQRRRGIEIERVYNCLKKESLSARVRAWGRVVVVFSVMEIHRDDGLKSLLSLLNGSPEAQLSSSKPIVYCFPDRPSSSVIKESSKPIQEYSSRIKAMSSRDIGTSTAWLESLKQIASQDKCSGKVASEVDSMFSRLKEIEGEEQAVRAGKGAAFLAHKSFSRICWASHEEKVFSKDPDALHRVQWEVLKVLMMLALSVYDMEDFTQNVHQEELNAERLKFTKALFCSYKTANEAILATGKVEMVENFPLLYECDVNNILEQWRKQSDSHQNFPKVTMAERSWMFEDARVSEVLTECAITPHEALSTPEERLCNAPNRGIGPGQVLLPKGHSLS